MGVAAVASSLLGVITGSVRMAPGNTPQPMQTAQPVAAHPEKPSQLPVLPVRYLQRPVAHTGATLHAALIDPEDPENTVKVLTGKNITPQDLPHLLTASHVKAVMNGTFFDGNTAFSDIVGFRVSDPQKACSPPFVSRSAAFNHKLMQRFYLGIDHQNRLVTGRRADLVDARGRRVPAGTTLSPYFKTYIGGGALVDFDDARFRAALDSGRPAAVEAMFNRINPMINHQAAFDGVEGGHPLARTALGIVRLKGSGKPLLVMLTIGHGTQRNVGVTLHGLIREFKALARETGTVPAKILVLDSASSTFWGQNTPASGNKTRLQIENALRRPNTAVAWVGVPPRPRFS